ncbi:MAG: hypothetical protein KKF16_06770 [Euryarchaeota archaeon]|nr:hypothetical protein [Euryarchaeota archaeon]
MEVIRFVSGSNSKCWFEVKTPADLEKCSKLMLLSKRILNHVGSCTFENLKLNSTKGIACCILNSFFGLGILNKEDFSGQEFENIFLNRKLFNKIFKISKENEKNYKQVFSLDSLNRVFKETPEESFFKVLGHLSKNLGPEKSEDLMRTFFGVLFLFFGNKDIKDIFH